MHKNTLSYRRDGGKEQTMGMNRYQENYAVAKAAYEVIKSVAKDAEKEYIRESGIKNPDGTIPDFLWTMDDEEAFEAHLQKFGEILLESGLEAKENAARERLRAAEDALIEFGISLAPAGIRETLRNGAKSNASIRERLLDAAFRLDITTIQQPPAPEVTRAEGGQYDRNTYEKTDHHCV